MPEVKQECPECKAAGVTGDALLYAPRGLPWHRSFKHGVNVEKKAGKTPSRPASSKGGREEPSAQQQPAAGAQGGATLSKLLHGEPDRFWW